MLDLDHEALAYSLDQLPPHIRKLTIPICTDVVAMSRTNPSELSGMRFDYIYSAGLLDYLPDGVAASLMQKCMSLLKANGEMEFGNFELWPAAFFVDMICGWRLILRGEDELSRLAPANARSLVFSKVADQVFMRL